MLTPEQRTARARTAAQMRHAAAAQKPRYTMWRQLGIVGVPDRAEVALSKAEAFRLAGAMRGAYNGLIHGDQVWIECDGTRIAEWRGCARGWYRAEI